MMTPAIRSLPRAASTRMVIGLLLAILMMSVTAVNP